MVMKYTKTLVLLALSVILIGCKVNVTATNIAVKSISEFAQGKGEEPTVELYLGAGATGVTQENLLVINQTISELEGTDVDSLEEIQSVINRVNEEHTIMEPIEEPVVDTEVIPTQDTTAPSITIVGDMSMNIIQGGAYAEQGATATDNIDGNLTVVITSDVNTSILGDYNITYIATDMAGNTTTAIRTVSVVPFTVTHNGTTYGIVTSPDTGKVWLDRNLGSAQVCTSFDDEACYGDYYQWGRNFDGHQDSMSATSTILLEDVNNIQSRDFIINKRGDEDWTLADNNGSLRKNNWQATDGSSVCPIGFRVPTSNEFEKEIDIYAASTNRDTAFASFLKFPSAGSRSGKTGVLDNKGSGCSLWTTTLNQGIAVFLNYSAGSSDTLWGEKAQGNQIRCVKDEYTL